MSCAPPLKRSDQARAEAPPPVLFRALGGATNQRYAGRGGPRPSLLVRCSQRKPDAHPHVSPRAEDPWEETWARGEHTSTQAAAHLNCCRMVQNCPCPALGAGRCALPWCRGARHCENTIVDSQPMPGCGLGDTLTQSVRAVTGTGGTCPSLFVLLYSVSARCALGLAHTLHLWH